ncbi:hypothetical protein Thiosp_02924 [Thiorhodovibrio litoralis]|nr:hypothetical protein [Thiorhodovibrio winogradskyi]WPL13132.1 hypothetical protein Thiosp_02924 [Thiorhodovibrio litoralis]
MEFTYTDESGSTEDGDVFVIASLLIDAYRLRKCTLAPSTSRSSEMVSDSCNPDRVHLSSS